LKVIMPTKTRPSSATVLRVQLAPNTLRSETAALALLALLAAHLA
jgi:16S rRNA U1498 N3-methylase RsmE